MRDITCCFTGHRIVSNEKTEELKMKIYDTCESLINGGYSRFLCGGAIGFDMLCAICVLALKKKYPDIQLELIIPCRDQASKWNKSQKSMYEYILNSADDVRVLNESYVTGCMQQRNKLMVDESSVCVAHLERNYGGTKSTVDYALSNDVKVIYL